MTPPKLSPTQTLASDLNHSLLRQQPPQAQIIYHILHILDTILDPIAPLPQRIVLEIEDLKPSVHVFDEPRYLQWTAVIA